MLGSLFENCLDFLVPKSLVNIATSEGNVGEVAAGPR